MFSKCYKNWIKFIKLNTHLNNTESSTRNGVREVTSWWRYSSDNTDWTFTIGISQAFDSGRRDLQLFQFSIFVIFFFLIFRFKSFIKSPSSSFVETGESSTQISWITGIGRHFSQTSGNFTKSFGPTWCRICHHGYVVTHVSEVFRKSDTCKEKAIIKNWQIGKFLKFKKKLVY